MVEDITRLLPTTVNTSESPAYFGPDYLTVSSGSQRAELSYDSSRFEKPPTLEGFLDPFIEFYKDNKKTEPRIEKPEPTQPRKREAFIFEGDQHIVTIGLDQDKYNLFFIYKKSDEDIIKLVDDFILMLFDS